MNPLFGTKRPTLITDYDSICKQKLKQQTEQLQTIKQEELIGMNLVLPINQKLLDALVSEDDHANKAIIKSIKHLLANKVNYVDCTVVYAAPSAVRERKFVVSVTATPFQNTSSFYLDEFY